MTVLDRLSGSILEGRNSLNERRNCNFEKVYQSCKIECENILASGDSIDFINYLKNSGYKGKFKAVYLDPPFFSKAKYNSTFSLEDEDGKSHKIKMEAYDDNWNNSLESYIKYIASMVYGIHELLSDEGVVMLHIDWHASHYCRLILDHVFGSKNFVNEIIWTYKSGGAGGRSFARKHDNILIYGKTGNYTYNQSKVKSYNRNYSKYGFKGVEEFQDENGWYTLVNERDVWFMDMVGRTSKERTGYATQKPKALLEKLVKAFTNEGDLVGDFCVGSGTTAKVCHDENRKWICADINNSAITMILGDLCHKGAKFNLLTKDKENFMLSGSILSFDEGLFLTNLTDEKDNLEMNRLREKLPKESFEIIKEIGTKRPDSIVNFVSFDFDYNGEIHKSDYSFGCRKEYYEFLDSGLFSQDEKKENQMNNKGKRKMEKKMQKKRVHIFYGDVFGGFSEKEQFEDE